MPKHATATVAAVLFFAGWVVWFASKTVGSVLMGTGGALATVGMVRDWSAQGGVTLARAWRAQSRATRDPAAGAWLGGDGGGLGAGDCAGGRGAFGGGGGGGGGGGC